MRKLQRFFLASVVALGLGLTGCSDDVSDANEPGAKGTTYASLSIAFPKTAATRADLPENYNPNGTWKGRDTIQTITVFLVNESLGTIDHTSFKEGNFDLGIDGSGTLEPKLAIKATPGEKVKAYVVINDAKNKVTDALKKVTPSKFSEAFSAAAEAIASEVSAHKDGKDVILMTNTVEPTTVTIEAGVTAEQAIKDKKNLIQVNVQRVVSRAIVTVKTDFTKTIDVADANGVKGSTITIKDVKYGVGQSNRNFFILQKKDFLTPGPVYTYKPGDVDASKFDNSGLAAMSEVSKIADKANANVVAALGTETPGKFVLPVTHAAGEYVKGNTTYFEVTAIFTPDKVAVGTIEIEGESKGSDVYTDGNDVFLGMNTGLFYNSRALAEASGQKATMYTGTGTTVTTKGAIMKYVLWLNPDNIPGPTGDKATMSPTVRNQVYHAHIKGFKQIGLPNNPLNPDDPNINFPGNPINPIKPEDPLQTEDTYLSVQITVLKWGVHSYEIDLGNDY